MLFLLACECFLSLALGALMALVRWLWPYGALGNFPKLCGP